MTVHVEQVGRVLGGDTSLECFHGLVELFAVLKDFVDLLVVLQLDSSLFHVSELFSGHSTGHGTPGRVGSIKGDDRSNEGTHVVVVVRSHLSQIPLDQVSLHGEDSVSVLEELGVLDVSHHGHGGDSPTEAFIKTHFYNKFIKC